MFLSAVILSEHCDLPFNDILDWKNFSLILKKDNVSQVKTILEGISDSQQFIELLGNTINVNKY